MTTPQQENFFVRWTGSAWFWLCVVLLIASFPVTRAIRAELPKPLPVYKALPEFSFQNQFGETMGSAELRGKIYVANFIFTRCKTICPIFTDQMHELQRRTKQIADAGHLVSFTVDPEYDTPEVLLEYAKNNKVSPRMWSFLTGDIDAIKATVVEGFNVAMGGSDGSSGDHSGLWHGSYFVLVDYEGRVRGFYDSRQDGILDELLGDMNILINIPGIGELPPNYTPMDPTPASAPEEKASRDSETGPTQAMDEDAERMEVAEVGLRDRSQDGIE